MSKSMFQKIHKSNLKFSNIGNWLQIYEYDILNLTKIYCLVRRICSNAVFQTFLGPEMPYYK